MKKLLLITIVGSMISSCGSSRVCNHNGEEIDCAYYDLYTEHSGVEAEINASFDESVIMTFEEEYALREKWVALYNASPDSLKKAYELVGQSDQLDFITEMRLKEFDYYKEKKVERAELKEFLKSLEITATESDTSVWGFQKPSLNWIVKNNSDKTIKNFQFDLNYLENGEIVSQKSNYFIMFTAEQITPQPGEDEDAVVKPGSSVMMSFDRPEGGVQPEIVRVNFVEEE